MARERSPYPLGMTLSDFPLVRAFTLCAAAEGVTFVLLLLVAVPLKHLAGLPEMVRLLGPVHGLAFLSYIYCLLRLYQIQLLSGTGLAQGVLAAFLPGGSWAFHRRVSLG